MLRRIWQIYTAHLLVFLVLIGEIAYVTAVSESHSISRRWRLPEFFKEPGQVIIQALLLRYRPLNMDVLPLYIVLMAFLPLVLMLARWRKDLPLILSIVLYILAIRFDLHLSTYRDGFWSFNPFAWQLLFVSGVWCALGGGRRISPMIGSPVTLGVAIVYLLAAFFITMTWYFPYLETLLPAWLIRAIYPISKADFDVLRFAHFLALAVIALRLVPGDWPGLRSAWFRPLILCGQYSLQIYAIGVVLSFAGYALLMEISAGVVLHVIIGIIGILVMCGVAWAFTWYKWATIGRGRAQDPVAIELTRQRP